MATPKVNVHFPNLGELNIEMRLEGQWQALDKLAANLQPAVLRGYHKGVNEFSKKLLRVVKRALTTGIPPPGGGVVWPPLSPSTIRRWGNHPIYNLTGSYSRSIGMFTYKGRTYVGLPYNAKRSSRGKLTMNQLAKILEFGAKGEDGESRIPPRPVWKSSLRSVGGMYVLRNTVVTAIRSQLISSAGIHPRKIR